MIQIALADIRAEKFQQAAPQIFGGRAPCRRADRQIHAHVRNEFSTLDHDNPIGKYDGLIDIVGNQQHRGVMHVREPAQQGMHLHPGQRVERTEGFIGE